MDLSRLQDMSVFRFKYFSVANKDSAMKVNTDGVLLGALMTIRPEAGKTILRLTRNPT